MAPGILGIPGTAEGPCVEPCEHSDCHQTRAQAESICRFCNEPIGFDSAFYKDEDIGAAGALVHQTCARGMSREGEEDGV